MLTFYLFNYKQWVNSNGKYPHHKKNVDTVQHSVTSVRTFRLCGEPDLLRAFSWPQLIVGHHPEDINSLGLQVVHRQLETLRLCHIHRPLSVRSDERQLKHNSKIPTSMLQDLILKIVPNIFQFSAKIKIKAALFKSPDFMCRMMSRDMFRIKEALGEP